MPKSSEPTIVKSNIKLAGSNIRDCVPQTGHCPIDCNECWHNRHPNTERIVPEPSDDKIIRMNSRHDSNVAKNTVLAFARNYKEVFFNTSIADFNLPGPVVWTANPKEEEPVPEINLPNNVMFVRLRVSLTNLHNIREAVYWITDQGVPVVLTFMSYYKEAPDTWFYEYGVRHENRWWCPKPEFVDLVMSRYKDDRLVHYCGDYCNDCKNCELFYWLCKKKITCTLLHHTGRKQPSLRL